ncbi:hypothetical protein [Streptomyces sp. AS02]|uniref:hypothetical protein n=1 Tax=Streptomyces sp. AS02 TaxID=2938946 RepID=UPI0027E5A157|nr:hypothetical protein [Streptomyces sp. AS02]
MGSRGAADSSWEAVEASGVEGAVVGSAGRDGVGDALDLDGDGGALCVGEGDAGGCADRAGGPVGDGSSDASLVAGTGTLGRTSSGSAVSRVGFS